MFDFILNPEGVSYIAFVIFWIGALIAVMIGIGAGVVSMFKYREKRDERR